MSRHRNGYSTVRRFDEAEVLYTASMIGLIVLAVLAGLVIEKIATIVAGGGT